MNIIESDFKPIIHDEGWITIDVDSLSKLKDIAEALKKPILTQKYKVEFQSPWFPTRQPHWIIGKQWWAIFDVRTMYRYFTYEEGAMNEEEEK